jgi:hypothetical protein
MARHCRAVCLRTGPDARFAPQIITDSSMKIQSWILAGALASLCYGAHAQTEPAQDRAAAVEAARENLIKRAEGLTEEQIKASKDLSSLSKLAQIYNASQDMQRFIWVLQRVTELTPNSGDLRLQLALAYAKIGDKTHAYDTLIRMQMQGFGYDIAQDPRFEPVHGTKVWDYLVANLQVNSRQFGEGKAAFDLPKGDNLFDALAWDAKRGQLLVGGARDGAITRVDASGKVSEFIAANHDWWGIDALGVDAAHGKLYAASSATAIYHGFNADNAGKAGVFEFDLASGKLLRKYTFAQDSGAHRLTSLVVASDGAVYAADGMRKQVFRLDNGTLKQVLQNPRLNNITALAVSGDGRTLYLADFALGIFGYDLAKGQAFQVRYNPQSLVLGGIVGMYWYDGTLAVIENDMIPKRVMRLQLSADGRTIEHAIPLDAAQPAFVELGNGTVAGDKLYFFANREDALYDSHGVLTGADKLKPATVFASNLRFAWGEKGVASGPAPMIIDDKTKPAAPAPSEKKH